MVATQGFAIIVIVMAVFNLAKEFISLITATKDYLKTFENLYLWPLYGLSIFFVYVFPNDCGCPTRVQWRVGIFVLFLGWLHMIFIASNLPGTGKYVIMFRDIFKTFSQLVLFALLLVTAFSVILFMMFNNPLAKVL